MVKVPSLTLPQRERGKLFETSILLNVLMLFVSIPIIAQPTAFIHQGLVKTMGTFGVGRMTAQNVQNIYLHTELEYFGSDNISIKGETDFFVSSGSETKPFEFNHATFTGIAFHFTIKNAMYLDPYWALEPGIAYLKLSSSENNPSRIASFDPLFSTALGFNYYAKKLIYFSCNVRYVAGQHLSSDATSIDNKPLSLSEVRFMFGLGLHFN
jgi:hypothetical protein